MGELFTIAPTYIRKFFVAPRELIRIILLSFLLERSADFISPNMVQFYCNKFYLPSFVFDNPKKYNFEGGRNLAALGDII